MSWWNNNIHDPGQAGSFQKRGGRRLEVWWGLEEVEEEVEVEEDNFVNNRGKLDIHLEVEEFELTGDCWG